jgi:hypothetical protein
MIFSLPDTPLAEQPVRQQEIWEVTPAESWPPRQFRVSTGTPSPLGLPDLDARVARGNFTPIGGSPAIERRRTSVEPSASVGHAAPAAAQDTIEASSEARLRLLAVKFAHNRLTPEQKARLEIIDAYLDRISPLVTETQAAALSAFASRLAQLDRETYERRRRLDLA